MRMEERVVRTMLSTISESSDDEEVREKFPFLILFPNCTFSY